MELQERQQDNFSKEQFSKKLANIYFLFNLFIFHISPVCGRDLAIINYCIQKKVLHIVKIPSILFTFF